MNLSNFIITINKMSNQNKNDAIKNTLSCLHHKTEWTFPSEHRNHVI